MKKFEVGMIYYMRSACDHECIWTYKVVARTDKTITLMDRRTGKILKCRVSKYSSGSEEVKPLGSYSMAPILRAEMALEAV